MDGTPLHSAVEESQQPIIAQFLEIVGGSDNVEHAVEILRSCNWNLEVWF